jgi:hypothetical protein
LAEFRHRFRAASCRLHPGLFGPVFLSLNDAVFIRQTPALGGLKIHGVTAPYKGPNDLILYCAPAWGQG